MTRGPKEGRPGDLWKAELFQACCDHEKTDCPGGAGAVTETQCCQRCNPSCREGELYLPSPALLAAHWQELAVRRAWKCSFLCYRAGGEKGRKCM